MALWMVHLVLLVLTAIVETSLSQKSGCRAPGHINIELQPEKQVNEDPCAAASITSVHVCEDGEWKAICGEKFTHADIKVLCRAKGFSSIGANMSVMSQTIGSAVSSLTLRCNGSETNPNDCMMKNQDSAISHNCRRTIIQCFLTDPDPQLCNISLPTAPSEYKITVSSNTTTMEATMVPVLASTATTEAPFDLSLVGHTTVAKRRSHKMDSSNNITVIVAIIGIITMVVVSICFASPIMTYFVVRRSRKVGQKSKIERSRQEHKESRTTDNDSQHTVIMECSKRESQRQDMEHVHKYTQNEAYGSKPVHNNFLWHGDDKQQAVEPIYDTIPEPTLKS